jgi:hypothetical protein
MNVIHIIVNLLEERKMNANIKSQMLIHSTLRHRLSAGH